jgi:hypothetical protein
MNEDNSTVEVVVSIESLPLRISITKKCELSQVNETIELILNELQKSEKKLPKWANGPVTTTEKVRVPAPSTTTEDPFEKIAHRLDVEPSNLNETKLFGIKGEKVQIFKTQKFAPAEAVMAICYVSEIGVGKPALTYEELKEAFQESHIKSDSPLYMIISNVAKSGYVDKQRYDSQKEIVLTAKGETKIKEIIQKALAS